MAEPEQIPPRVGSGGGDEQPSSRSGAAYPIRFYIEEPAGNLYEAEALSTTLVRDVASDFFEERGWPTRGPNGQPMRGVVERLNPANPERTTRLNPNHTLEEAGVRDQDTLRVLPESVAGAVNPHERLRALVVDQREVLELAASDPERIQVRTNADHAPNYYEVTLRYTGVKLGDHGPELTSEHRVEIILPADYPLQAPVVNWLTPIFHPNISARGDVCLGILAERYLPGIGLAYIVRMLIDIARYRNYDLHGVYNLDACKWAQSPEGQKMIRQIGGAPEEQPMDVLLEQLRKVGRPRTRFTPMHADDEDL